jgi:DNA (cytosine-5)-methyltransferase 1
MRADVVLCGSQFGLQVRRHRWFETSWHAFSMVRPCDHSQKVFTVIGHGAGSRRYRTRPDWGTVAEWRTAMGIDWMTRDELTQAIPPEYATWIGHQLMAHLRG